MANPPNMKEVKRIFEKLWQLSLDETGNDGRDMTLAASMFFGVILAVTNDDEAKQTMCDAAMGYSYRVEDLMERFQLRPKH